MSEAPLSRIPFRAQDEAMIASMSRWMRFIAVYTIIVGLLLLLAALVGVSFLSLSQTLGEPPPELRKLMAEAGALIIAVLATAVFLAAFVVWSGFALYQAGDYFGLVARTDLADQDNLAKGFDKLRMYYKINVLLALAAVVLGLLVGVGVVLLSPRPPAAAHPAQPPHGGHHVRA